MYKCGLPTCKLPQKHTHKYMLHSETCPFPKRVGFLKTCPHNVIELEVRQSIPFLLMLNLTNVPIYKA